MDRMPALSVASYSFHGLHAEGRMDVFHYLSLIKYRYRVDHADIWSGFFPTTEDGFVQKVKSALAETGLTLANLCVDGAHVWEDDPGERSRNAQRATDFIRIGEALGARTIRIDTGGREAEWSEEAFDAIVRQYRTWAERAGEMGYRIGTENHWGATQRPGNVVKLAQAVNHPAFGVLFHFGNVKDMDMEEGNNLLVPYAMHTHVSAAVAETCGPLVKRLMDNGYAGVLSCEHHSAVHEMDRVEWQLGAIRKTLAELRAGEGV
jgi:sugar phosphate isomerase/epimerase